MQGSGLVASSIRTVPLRRRPDLEFSPLGDDPQAGWAVKDPLALEYHILESSQYAVLSQLNGETSLQQLERSIHREFPAQNWTIEAIQQLLIDLHKKGLVVSERPGQAQTFQEREDRRRGERWKKIFGQILSMKLPGWNADRTLEAMLPWVRWIYHPAAVTFWTLLVLSSWLLILVQFSEFRRRLPEFEQFFGWSNLGAMWATLAVTKVLHEFGHGLTCHYYGRRCHEMGAMILVFTPTLYCDVSDSWLLKDRWSRIWIGAGGMIFEIVLSAIATYVWWWTQPGLLNHMALNIVFVCAVTTALFNANPLMRYDGYYMLSDWLAIPNLRSKANRLLDRLLARWIFGHEVAADPLLPQHDQGWFAAYAVATTLYGWFVISSILLFLYSWMKPYQLQSVGMTFAVISLSGMVISMVWRGWRISRGPRHGAVRWHRVAITLLVCTAVVWGLLSLPIPWYVEAAALLEPAEGVAVLNSVPGRIRTILVQPGDHVAAGSPLMELENVELDDRVHELQQQIDAQAATVAAARPQQDVSEYTVATERLMGLRQQLKEAQQQQQRLRVLAPVSGVVVAAEERHPARDADRARLGAWSHTPLNKANLGGWLDVRTPLATIAPTNRLRATLYLPQAHRNAVQLNDAVSLKFDVLPGKVFQGQLTGLSHERATTVPVALSNKTGGALATVTTHEQEEQLQELAYRGEVTLTDDSGILRTGLRGRARFLVAHHTTAWWLMQTARRTFRFRM